jgi:hypothetical protein
VVQGVGEICVAGDQVVKQAAAGVVVLAAGGCMAAARGQVGGVEDGGVGIVLVELHGAVLRLGLGLGLRYGRVMDGRSWRLCQCAGAGAAATCNLQPLVWRALLAA